MPEITTGSRVHHMGGGSDDYAIPHHRWEGTVVEIVDGVCVIQWDSIPGYKPRTVPGTMMVSVAATRVIVG